LEAARIQQVLSAVEKTNDRYDSFKASLSAAVDDAAEAALKAVCDGLTPAAIERLTHTPVEVSNGAEAAAYLKDCQHLLILTGAGLSAASGIPTFRGAGGFWTKTYDGVEDPCEILT